MPSTNLPAEGRHQGTDHANRNARARQSSAGRNPLAITWAEAIGSQPHSTDMVLYMTPTFHTIDKDGMPPFPFEVHPHLHVLSVSQQRHLEVAVILRVLI